MSGRVLPQIFGAIAVVGSVVVMLTLYFCKFWRSRLPPVKAILAVISVFNFFTAANYLYHTRDGSIECRIQASIMQFFEISGTLYAFVMALETNVLIGVVQRNSAAFIFGSSRETLYRHLTYHVAVMGFGLGTTLWMDATDSFSRAGNWCWISKPDYALYFGYIPMWTSVLGIAIMDFIVIRTVYKSIRMKEATNNPPLMARRQASNSKKNYNAKFSTTVVRLLLYPIFMVLLFIPGSVVRIMEYGGIDEKSVSFEVFKVAQSICDPSKGTINVLMWVVSDVDVRKEISELFRSSWLFRLTSNVLASAKSVTVPLSEKSYTYEINNKSTVRVAESDYNPTTIVMLPEPSMYQRPTCESFAAFFNAEFAELHVIAEDLNFEEDK